MFFIIKRDNLNNIYQQILKYLVFCKIRKKENLQKIHLLVLIFLKVKINSNKILYLDYFW